MREDEFVKTTTRKIKRYLERTNWYLFNICCEGGQKICPPSDLAIESI